jgi:hypothetical protein
MNSVLTDLTKSRETYTEGSDEETQLVALKTFQEFKNKPKKYRLIPNVFE